MSECRCKNKPSIHGETKIKRAQRDPKDRNAWMLEVEDENGQSSTITVLSMGSFGSIEEARRILL